MVTMYGYPKCSTCVKAKKALESNGVEVDYKHIVDETPSAATIRELHQKSGEPLKKFFNTSGPEFSASSCRDGLTRYPIHPSSHPTTSLWRDR